MSFNELRDRYIAALENPDSIGFNPDLGIWTPPTLRGYDQNQIGIGLDMKQNKDVVQFFKDHPRQNPFLTEEEEHKLRSDSYKYFDEVWERKTQGQVFSDKKRAIAFGLLYHGIGPILWNENHPLNQALFNGTDEDFEKAVSDFYANKFSERQRNHDAFWKKRKEEERLQKIKKAQASPFKGIPGGNTITPFYTPQALDQIPIERSGAKIWDPKRQIIPHRITKE